MGDAETFDCLLSHNSKDKPAVRGLATALRAAGVSVWLDEEQLRPGLSSQAELEAGIRASRSVAVLVGADGLGPWEDEEQQAAIALAVRDKRPVIPVLLPGAPNPPDLPLFLANRTWVDLRPGADSASATGLERLVWGITGRKPDAGVAAPGGPAAGRKPGPAASTGRPVRPPKAKPHASPATSPPVMAQAPEPKGITRSAEASPCDVLLVYVNDKERAAIVATFVGPRGGAPRPRTVQGLPCLDLGRIEGRRVLAMATNMGSATPGGTATLIHDAILKLDPRWIIAVGVAFGMDADKAPVGTILVSDRVSCYEPQRVGRRRTIHRGDTVSVHPHLKQHLQTVSSPPYWTQAEVRFGEILSGEKLVDQPGFKGKLKTAYPEAIGGEMEAAGIYSAAMLERRDWIVVKAVCDYADGHKGQDKDANQALAAANAAAFVRHVLTAYGRASTGWVTTRASTDPGRHDGREAATVDPKHPQSPPADPTPVRPQAVASIHGDAVAAITECLDATPVLRVALSRQPGLAGAAAGDEIAGRLCDPRGDFPATLRGLKAALPKAARQLRQSQGDLASLRRHALAILGWMAVTTVLDGYDREDGPLIRAWQSGGALHIPLGRSPCVEVLTACWRRGRAEFSMEPERFDYGQDEITPARFGEIGFDDPKRLDLGRSVDYIWRRVYQQVHGQQAPTTLAPAKIEVLRAWLDLQIEDHKRRLRLVVDRHDLDSAFNFAATLQAIHDAVPQIHIIVIDSGATTDPGFFVLPASRLAAGIYDCLHSIKDLV